MSDTTTVPTKNQKLIDWVDEIAALTKPKESTGATARRRSTTA